eukprot:g44464.t1
MKGSDGVESVWIELRNRRGNNTIVGIMYRPPNSSQELGRKIHQETEKVCKKSKVTVIMGDFNVQLDWENQKKIESEVMVLQLNKGNYRGMREELGRIDW